LTVLALNLFFIHPNNYKSGRKIFGQMTVPYWTTENANYQQCCAYQH
jgi:hypothetical protein